MPKEDGSFQIIEKINGNAYKVELPSEYRVTTTFNEYEFSLFDMSDDLMKNHFEERGNDMILASIPRDAFETYWVQLQDLEKKIQRGN
jgi:hypothetical protein